MRAFHTFLGTETPIIQAPMAGVQGSALAVAVSNAGGLGSLPCATLSVAAMRSELSAIKAATDRPFNVNFFCHAPPVPDAQREEAWRGMLAPYYAEYGVVAPIPDPSKPARTPFNEEAATLIEEFGPAIVSFHFGLPSDVLMARVKGSGAKVIASATTVEEACWLEERGVDGIIAQGFGSGGTLRDVPVG
jgi:nitronate monooxygenase